MQQRDRMTWALAGAVAMGAAGLLMAQAPISGALAPPAGPVGDTGPSLTELGGKLDAIAASMAGAAPLEHLYRSRLVNALGESNLATFNDDVILEKVIIIATGTTDFQLLDPLGNTILLGGIETPYTTVQLDLGISVRGVTLQNIGAEPQIYDVTLIYRDPTGTSSSELMAE